MRLADRLLILLPAMVLASPAPAQLLLNDTNLDPALFLPSPPADGSALARAEVKQLHDIEAARTPAEFAHADADFKLKNVTVFAQAMGPGFDLSRLPETKKLFDVVRFEEKGSADRAKDLFKRNRPWIVDPTFHACSTADEPQSSYPSGHVTMGFAMASVLTRLAPDKAPAILARAADYAHSRLVCAMHFQSDVTAGEIWGTMIAERLMQQPSFRAQFDRAETELRSAGLVKK